MTFLKKEIKKKKTTKSKLDIDEFAKKLEATSGGGDLDEVEHPDVAETNTATAVSSGSFVAGSGSVVVSSSASTVNGNSGEHVDEEWKPFDSDENKDYSGLRININNWKVEDEYGDNEGGYNDSEKKPSFKWGEKNPLNKKEDDQNDDEKEDNLIEETAAQQKTSTETPSAKPVSAEIKPDAAAASTTASGAAGGAYIPPSLRRQQQAETSSSEKPSTTPAAAAAASETTSKYVPPSMRNKTSTESSSAIPTTSVNYRRPNKSQPNIMDTMEFPTLDAVDPSPSEKLPNEHGGEKFELPKRSGKVDQKSSNNMINLGNAFSALSS